MTSLLLSNRSQDGTTGKILELQAVIEPSTSETAVGCFDQNTTRIPGQMSRLSSELTNFVMDTAFQITNCCVTTLSSMRVSLNEKRI